MVWEVHYDREHFRNRTNIWKELKIRSRLDAPEKIEESRRVVIRVMKEYATTIII